MSNENIQDWMDWVTGLTGAGEGDLLLSKAEIEATVDSVISEMGIFHTDESTIPTTATARPRGAFDSPNDLRAYLESGGLLSYSETGTSVANPIVHILKINIVGRANPIYEVWIDDET